MKRIISAVLFLVLVFSSATSVMAEGPGADTPMPLYTGIASCYSDLRSNGNQMTLTGGITVWDDYTCKLTIFFQERDGYSGNWYTKSTYVATGSADHICSIDTTPTAATVFSGPLTEAGTWSTRNTPTQRSFSCKPIE